MRVPLSWLKDYVDLDVAPNDRAGVRALGEVLDRLGLVVEGIDFVGEGLAGVILARVVEIRPIEGADKIRLAVIDAGGQERIEVVCGAWNYGIGDVVPFAKVGVRLPNGMQILSRKMRGVTSNGMLCSPSELGLADDHEGLLVLAKTGSAFGELPTGLELGAEIADYLGIVADAVFDLSIEPNRPDALSIVGVARDLAASLGRSFTPPAPVVIEEGAPVATLCSVSVLSEDLCPRLVARVISGIASIGSPREIERRLQLAGMRPISAVVDVSNYVMLELGQPTHPYDLDQLSGRGLRVRRAARGEQLVTLDGVERTLGLSGSEDLLICDANDRPVGLAGIMGGRSSEISETTQEVLLEVAEFAPLAIGRTAAAQGLRSEASTRFWRGVDAEGLDLASDRFCELLREAHLVAGVTPPRVAAGRIESAPAPTVRRHLQLRTNRVNDYLGTSLGIDEIARLLAPLGFDSREVDGDLDVEIPGFRHDVKREVDLIEEVARLFGYDNIPERSRRSPFVGRRTPLQELRRALRLQLSAAGAHEAWTSSIIDPTLERMSGSQVAHVELSNPIVVNEVALRSHLLAGLCAAIRHNESHRNPELRLFEIGNVFFMPGAKDERPIERELVAVIFARIGDDATTAYACWQALVEGLLLVPGQFAIDQAAPGEFLEQNWLSVGAHPTRTARVSVAGDACAIIGEIDPVVQEQFGLAKRRLGWLVIDLLTLSECVHLPLQADPVSHFPSADVDLAFVVPDTVRAHLLERAIREAGGALAESVTLVDVYRGRGVESGYRSLSYRIRLGAKDRTLGESDIAEARSGIINSVEASLPALLRS